MSTPIELEKMRNTLVGERMEYERRIKELEGAISAALNELGVPGARAVYPAPVANAHDILTRVVRDA